MKKLTILTICFIIFLIIGFAIYSWISNQNSINYSNISDDYNAIRISSEMNSINKSDSNEENLYEFKTPIKSNDSNRLTNLKLTSSKINGTIVKSGTEFSFYKIVGPSNSEDGYKIADALDADGNTIKLIGGGNCQISTTLYNAVLGVSGLEVTERHEHSNDVAYIEDGKDAAVAYGHLNFKFKNNNDFNIKIYSTVTNNEVIVKIIKVN